MTNEQSLRKHLADLLDWGNAHITFDDAVKDFPRESRGVRPGNSPHSAWELPSPEPPSDQAWDDSVAAYRKHLRDFAALAADESVDLFAPIPHAEGKTALREVLLAADHNAYHLGQLMLVRRLL